MARAPMAPFPCDAIVPHCRGSISIARRADRGLAARPDRDRTPREARLPVREFTAESPRRTHQKVSRASRYISCAETSAARY